jgi:hypothetical protein
MFTFSIAAPSSLVLYPFASYRSAREEATTTTEGDKALGGGGEVRTYGSFNFTLRKRMNEDETIIDEQLRVDCPSIVDLRLVGSKDAFVACRGLLWTYNPALLPSMQTAELTSSQLKDHPRRMSVEALRLDLLLSAVELNGLSALWQLWRTVITRTDADETRGEEKKETHTEEMEKKTGEPSLIVRTQFREAHVSLTGKPSEHEQEVVRVMDAYLSRLAFVVDHDPSSASSLSIAGSAAEASLQDPLALYHARTVASTAVSAETDAIAFAYSSCVVPNRMFVREVINGRAV